jgi:hypothetical protein
VRAASVLSRAALAALFPLLLALPARAEPTSAELATARRLFQEATALERQSAWRDASKKLDAALAIKETPGLHFHRAHCAEQLGELVLAARHYARSEDLIRGGATAPDVEELLTAARARVLARVPRLTLAFPADVAGATLEIDGTRVNDPPGTPVLLDPGRHRIIARAPGRRDFEMEITLLEGQTQTLEVSLAPPPRADEAVAPAPLRSQPVSAEETSGFGTREIVLIGEATIAVAGLAIGIGFSIAKGSANDRKERAERELDEAGATDPDACSSPDAPPACTELQSAIDDADHAARFATIGFVTAGVGAAATLLTWSLWPTDTSATTAGIARTPGGATVFIRGRF